MNPSTGDVTSETPKPKFLDKVRQHLRALHYSICTEDAYVQWIRRFILFHGKRHPREMGEPEVEQFLTHLAVEGQVAASTQHQALAALLFLHKVELDMPLKELRKWGQAPLLVGLSAAGSGDPAYGVDISIRL